MNYAVVLIFLTATEHSPLVKNFLGQIRKSFFVLDVHSIQRNAMVSCLIQQNMLASKLIQMNKKNFFDGLKQNISTCKIVACCMHSHECGSAVSKKDRILTFIMLLAVNKINKMAFIMFMTNPKLHECMATRALISQQRPERSKQTNGEGSQRWPFWSHAVTSQIHAYTCPVPTVQPHASIRTKWKGGQWTRIGILLRLHAPHSPLRQHAHLLGKQEFWLRRETETERWNQRY